MTTQEGGSGTTRVVVASTVMLSFISFWRAAAVVLCDLASSSFYAGGIAEAAIGKAAPWFILGIMLFSYAIRAVYVESSAMFVRGGVYRVVHEAMGGTLAKFSVSALMFDYVLTGPISAVSAGLYVAGLINETLDLIHSPQMKVDPPLFAAFLAVAVTLYFWRKNLIGIHESSQKALRIMQLTTVLVVLLLVWGAVTLLLKSHAPVPLPTLENFRFGDEALGWLKGSGLESFWVIAALVGLGHSLLAMSGFETLAQVNREIAHPKLTNLKRAGNVIFLYSLIFTSMVSFLSVMLIPDAERTSKHLDNLIGGIAMHLAGPVPFLLLFHVFVVLVGAVILSGAVNTSMVGANGVLNRVAEDGVLPDWFRQPHRRFGTTHRMINLIAALQIITIVVSGGQIKLLGEAYAFGVVWSFAMKSLSVLVLRFKQPESRQWRVPMNFRAGRTEVPFGLGLITLSLFVLAVTNLFTKQVATVSGLIFTAAFFTVFQFSERLHRRRAGPAHAGDVEKFLLDSGPEVQDIRPGGVLAAVSNPNLLQHVRRAVEKTDTQRMDVVVLNVKLAREELAADQVFTTDTARLFSAVVSIAEKAGKQVKLQVVQGTAAPAAIIEAAARLKSSLIVLGASPRMGPDQQARLIGDAWETLPAPRPQMSVEIVALDGQSSRFYNLGPHPPRLWPEDVELLHQLWLELSARGPGHKLHHRDVVSVALRRMEQQLRGAEAGQILAELESAGSPSAK